MQCINKILNKLQFKNKQIQKQSETFYNYMKYIFYNHIFQHFKIKL